MQDQLIEKVMDEIKKRMEAGNSPAPEAAKSACNPGITEFVGKKNPSKGVKVEVGEKEAAVDVFVIVEFGVRIPEVAHEIQRSVKKAIESMTGLTVVEINVHIQGVAFPNDNRDVEHRVK
jgi:uncharacterized alkaline shock family protein YloU